MSEKGVSVVCVCVCCFLLFCVVFVLFCVVLSIIKLT